MANKYSPDRLNSGGDKWDVLVKNSSKDGDYSWRSFDTQLGDTMPGSFNRDFAWNAKDMALLALYDPNNRSNLSSEGRPGYILSNGTHNNNFGSYIEFGNIPQTYHTLKITGEYFQFAGTNPNWLYMRIANFQSGYFSRWSYNNAAATVSSQTLDNTSVWGISRGYNPDSFVGQGFDITMPGYSIPGRTPHWFGTRMSNGSTGELWGAAVGAGWTSGNISPWNTINSLQFFASDGYIHPESWIAIYGIK